MDKVEKAQDIGAESPEQNAPEPKKRVGRPTKAELQAKSRGGRGKVGRPKGDAAIMNEYKTRMLASPKSRRVLDKVFEVALNDEHRHQAACMKMIMDRVAPVGSFEREVVRSGGKNSINITISGVPGVSIEGERREDEPLEGDWEPVE